MKQQDFYQFSLLFCALLVVIGVGYFIYNELFPEYKIYQHAYKELEDKSVPFAMGIKQIFLPGKNNGPETIDRCISCHVATDLPHFSPDHPDYAWNKVDHDKKMEKVLQMHPLFEGETRPFEFHPMSEYGCTSCHGGNGRALVVDRAHGPVYDGEYEPAYHTHKPQFIEKDKVNDPPFARMYNNKPGHELVFQTTPLFAGPLMAAKCAQCHMGAKKIDKLCLSYERGKELFISQACYACHRITGFSRASVGPELTYAGLNYPWYIKESIVWPQADLPSSTMPNFRLDHEEVADLMAFLMAQTGEKNDFLMPVREWEAGAKMPWEKPVSSMQKGEDVFVTEGCASCHKLKGFDSPVEKEWFTKLFLEHASGSQIAKTVVAHRREIDEKLGKVETAQIESFYSNFKFAARALEGEDKERLKKVLGAYVANYGIGRDIAPPLNWSGVYRDDAWLMGHFQNPNAYTPRSIMPVMPFDETKFALLTDMLHALGAKNRDALREVWNIQGFSPPLAYSLLCSSCHGVHRQGNGPIAEWIYPIPKNLRNSLFLHNLTKERAIDSILQGVTGTPMPPWGAGENPVLTRVEAAQLVEWLYQGIPEGKEDFEKWSYFPEEECLDDKYYFKEKYYTSENLQEGERLFLVNCATCHGADAAGTGLRATSMVEAKPRMLTNLPWLRSRDDLYLLRSIKYGVPGTAMTPWGDVTTDEQRMQLVLFIRQQQKDKK